ncbi:hypothetical protein NP233_g4853 [Leucocoprinus birnbaumii]|uniref:Uncharacterized protein n=1 Tax=Leucocoprinus birnbaumii TaxID=56174 RepID=A0AAD5VWL9_9AGAR|nr:hypothetical protein NP233_g4853 [Leucocoprinus birnbaumii]
MWRHVESYTLYGSTICPNTCREPTDAVTADEVATSSNGTSGGASSIRDNLPVGWSTEFTRDDYRTTIILVLSLVLAFFICFFMIGCLLWRKTVKRRHKAGDVEMKARRKRRSTPATPSPLAQAQEEQRKAKGKQKIWARATARWKDHARYSARFRKSRRPSISSHLRQYSSSATLNPATPIETPADNVSTTQSLTPTPSRSVSRRPSTSSSQSSHSSLHLPQETPDNSHTSPSLTFDTVPDGPSSPPAYRRGTLLSPVAIPAEHSSVPDEPAGSTLSVPSPRPSSLSLDPSSSGVKSLNPALVPESSHIFGPHAAHVATDDKALLARLAERAEQPPDAPDDAQTSPIVVPLWEDERIDDFRQTSASSDPDTSGSSSELPFPPPPSKGKMAEPSFYTYRSSFEQFSDSIDPELEPSAPPFEAPSAPVLDGMAMLPSAPPLAEDGFPLEGFPDFEATAEGDGTQETATVDSDGSSEHQTPASARPLSEGTLPGYHP